MYIGYAGPLADLVAERSGNRWISSRSSATSVFGQIANWGPSFDGLFIVPAIVGAIILALVADVGIRTMPARPATA